MPDKVKMPELECNGCGHVWVPRPDDDNHARKPDKCYRCQVGPDQIEWRHVPGENGQS